MYKDYEIKLNAILDKHGVQKVDLANINEVKNMLKEIDRLISEQEDAIVWFRKAEKKSKEIIEAKKYITDGEGILRGNIKRVETLEKEGNSLYSEMIKDAKNLGIDGTKIPEVKKLSTNLTILKKRNRGIKDRHKKVKGLLK